MRIILFIYLFLFIFSIKSFAAGPVYWTESTIVIDALNSTSTTAALSANQGKNLNDRLGGSGSLVVVGPASSVDNSIALFDGDTGKLIKGDGFLTYTAGETLNVGMDGGEIRIIGDWTTGGPPSLSINEMGPGGGILRFLSGGDVTLTFPTGPPLINQILQSDATGKLSWINTPTSMVVPTCTGSQRLTGNGTTLSCVDNNFTNLGSIAAAGTATCVITANHICYYTATGNHTVAFSGTPINGMMFQVIVASTAAYSITWPAMKWPGGTASTLTKANAHSVFTIVYTPGGYLVTGVEDLK